MDLASIRTLSYQFSVGALCSEVETAASLFHEVGKKAKNGAQGLRRLQELDSSPHKVMRLPVTLG